MTIVRTALAMAGVALLIGACGSSSPSSSTTSSQSPQNAVAQAYKFSACMRNHGVTDFPDPKVTSNGNQQSIAIQAVGAKTPAFKAASIACRGILPPPSNADLAAEAAQQRAHTQDLLSFARCMRGRGVNGFPDPTAQGQFTLQMITNAGVDLHAPQVAVAARACIPASHGVVTPADIAQATGSSG
ncbi:MAG TPA: hypothetical protein VMF57_12495 [Solirubrobacteraceae bacterium]|nr:hypothetical protein [Solirubrobacteraceae bacterium]